MVDFIDLYIFEKLIQWALRKIHQLNFGNKNMMSLDAMPNAIWPSQIAESALDLSHVKVGVPYSDFKVLNIKSTSMFFLLGEMIRMMRLRTSFILLIPSWEIGSPLTGSAYKMKCSCVVSALNDHAYLTHSYILKRDLPPQCIFTFWWSAIILLKQGQHILRFHPTLIIIILMRCSFFVRIII